MQRGRRIQKSGHSDLESFQQCRRTSILTWVWRILRRSLVQRIQVVWQQNAELLQPSFEMLTSPAPVNAAYEPELSFTTSPRTTFIIFGTVAPIPSSCGGSSPPVSKNELSFPFFCDFLMTSFLLVTFVTCHAGIFRAFPTLCQLRPSHPELSLLGVWVKACVQDCNDSMN